MTEETLETIKAPQGQTKTLVSDVMFKAVFGREGTT